MAKGKGIILTKKDYAGEFNLMAAERKSILDVLNNTKSMSAACRKLEMDDRRLYNKMYVHSIKKVKKPYY